MRLPSAWLTGRAGPSVSRHSTSYTPRFSSHPSHPQSTLILLPRRTFLSLFKTKPQAPQSPFKAPEPQIVLAPDDLFHPLIRSPFPDLKDRAERVKTFSICPVSVEKHNERVRPAFDCPDCGWPTHKNQERWEEGYEEHAEYCERLREVNEDDHDLRSGRKITEFEGMPSMSWLLVKLESRR